LRIRARAMRRYFWRRGWWWQWRWFLRYRGPPQEGCKKIPCRIGCENSSLEVCFLWCFSTLEYVCIFGGWICVNITTHTSTLECLVRTWLTARTTTQARTKWWAKNQEQLNVALAQAKPKLISAGTKTSFYLPEQLYLWTTIKKISLFARSLFLFLPLLPFGGLVFVMFLYIGVCDHFWGVDMR
jgi:hypothetical protein